MEFFLWNELDPIGGDRQKKPHTSRHNVDRVVDTRPDGVMNGTVGTLTAPLRGVCFALSASLFFGASPPPTRQVLCSMDAVISLFCGHVFLFCWVVFFVYLCVCVCVRLCVTLSGRFWTNRTKMVANKIITLDKVFFYEGGRCLRFSLVPLPMV